jgi:hypothetical protein
MTGTPLQKRLARQMSKSRAEGFVRASKFIPLRLLHHKDIHGHGDAAERPANPAAFFPWTFDPVTGDDQNIQIAVDVCIIPDIGAEKDEFQRLADLDDLTNRRFNFSEVTSQACLPCTFSMFLISVA